MDIWSYRDVSGHIVTTDLALNLALAIMFLIGLAIGVAVVGLLKSVNPRIEAHAPADLDEV